MQVHRRFARLARCIHNKLGAVLGNERIADEAGSHRRAGTADAGCPASSREGTPTHDRRPRKADSLGAGRIDTGQPAGPGSHRPPALMKRCSSLILAAVLAGCAADGPLGTMGHRETGTLIGAAGGAVIGAIAYDP